MSPQFFCSQKKTKSSRRGSKRLVVDAYAGEKRIIPLPGAGHNSPIEGAALADFYRALDWLAPR